MINERHDINDKALEELEQIIGKAINARADSIILEYADEGLEVCYMLGNIGLGSILVDPVLERGIIRLIVDRAKLDNKSKGTMVWAHSGKKYHITVKEYDYFGESAFELILNKAKH